MTTDAVVAIGVALLVDLLVVAMVLGHGGLLLGLVLAGRHVGPRAGRRLLARTAATICGCSFLLLALSTPSCSTGTVDQGGCGPTSGESGPVTVYAAIVVLPMAVLAWWAYRRAGDPDVASQS